VLLAVVEDESPVPVAIGLLAPERQVSAANLVSELV
jgi:hypothetical protein